MKTSEKVQRARVGVAGSFINQMMSNNSSLPVVGQGATVMHYSDRTAYEVIEVSKDGKTVKIEELNASWDKTKEGGMGHQNWILTPSGYFKTLVWKWGAWRQKSEKVMFTDEYAETLDSKFHGSEDYKKCFVDGEMVVAEGITELVVSWSPIKIIFGRKDYYYDWSF